MRKSIILFKDALPGLLTGLLTTLLLGTALSLCSVSASSAEGRSLNAAEQRLALRVARIAAHEGALRNIREVDLIWQVTTTRAATVGGRYAFLGVHSPRAVGLKPCTGASGNCRWSPLLDAAGTLPSTIAPEDIPHWRGVTLPKWHRILERAQALVSGELVSKPCSIDPYTWGSLRLDRRRAALSGLYPIGCAGQENDDPLERDDGFAFKAPRTVP